MAWDDVLFGILTGGAYNVAKGAVEAGEAAGSIADDVGKSAAAITQKVTMMMDDIDAFIRGLEGMVVIERAAPRTEDELWDEEVQRLKDFRAKETDLVAQLAALGGSDDAGSLTGYIMGAIFGPADPNAAKKSQLAVQILIVRSAIRDLLYTEPGIGPETIYQAKEILERFHTLEQPRIEEIMDTTDDTIEETKEVIGEVRKLFVIRRWVVKEPAKLSAEEKNRLGRFQMKKDLYDHLIAKHEVVADFMKKGLETFQPAAQVTGLKRELTLAGATSPAVAEYARSASGMNLARATIQAPLGNLSSRFIRPQAAAYISSYTAIQGRIRFYEREQLKADKAIFSMTYELVEEPGVIPKTLEEVHLSIQRFRTQEQPRIEKIMDSANETILESRGVLKSVDLTVQESQKLLANLNTGMETSQGVFDALSKYRVPILIGCAFMGLLVVAIMVMVLVVLIKIALH
jgi:hypothetical protein